VRALAPEHGVPPVTVRLENFTGPYGLLLQLISQHQLEITELALHQVTDEFIAHLRELGDSGDLDETTAFLVTAATLLDLEASRLVPSANVEDLEDLAILEAGDLLFARLLQYKAYKQVAALFAELAAGARRRYPRAVALEERYAGLLPEVSLGVDAAHFAQTAAAVLSSKPAPEVPVEHLHTARVSVAEHAELLCSQLAAAEVAPFGELVADCGETVEVVARFLALLDLYREARVAFEQPVRSVR
jgi:segregation and condensation protein A